MSLAQIPRSWWPARVPDESRRLRARPLVVAGVLLAALLIAYVALSGRVVRSHDGPLYTGEDGGLVCLQKRSETAISFGFNIVRNTGSTPIVLQAVRLVAPVGLTMVSAEVVPVTNDLIGAVHGYPPPGWVLSAPGVDWEGRRSLAGTRLEPGQELNVLARLTDPADVKVTGLDALRIDYEADGRLYQTSTTVRLRIRPACDVSDRATYG